MDSNTRSTVTTAAALSGMAFLALLVGVPLMLNSISDLESELIGQHQAYMQLSNKMWTDLMSQSEEMRPARAQYVAAVRQKRQYDAPNNSNDPKKKNECPAGPKGAPGQPGVPGMDGMNGLPGKPGDGAPVESDNPYDQGVYNPSCGSCPAGPPGHPGYKGKRGRRGEKGQKGPQGNAGRDGLEGEEGPEGEAGYPGDIGSPGEKGAPGEDGIGYARGPPGLKGETGMPGALGDEGLPGDRGDDSPPGPQGEQGPQGPKGEKGKDGIPGLPGQAGNPGHDAEYCPCPERSENTPEQPNYGRPKSAAPTKLSYDESTSDAPPASPYENSSNGPAELTKPADTPAGYQSAASRRFAAYSKLAHAVALRRRHL